jgi:hypothetical protein
LPWKSGTYFLGAAVHRVHELEVADAVVVHGLGLDEHFSTADAVVSRPDG